MRAHEARGVSVLAGLGAGARAAALRADGRVPLSDGARRSGREP